MASTILLLIPITVTLAAAVFWLWMFYEMLHDYRMPPQVRQFYIVAFVFLSLLAAGHYYFNQYKNR